MLLAFYGDDWTGSTDALEQLTLANIPTRLFVKPPTRKQIAELESVQAIGVAGMTRSMSSREIERELTPMLKALRALGAPHVHYKVCSTFDSSPTTGSIGRVIDVAMKIFPTPFVPVLIAAPTLGRYCVFGNLFARFGIGSEGEIHRLDRHPVMSRHPITPMLEADLGRHLAKQTKKKIALFDLLKIALPTDQARRELQKILEQGAEVVLFDLLMKEQLARVGALIDSFASRERPLFSVGSSGIEMALGAHWKNAATRRVTVPLAEVANPKQILVGSGSCSAVTTGQIAWALQNGFAEVPLDISVLSAGKTARHEIPRATEQVIKLLKAGRSVVVHTGNRRAQSQCAPKAKDLGSTLGTVLRRAVEQTAVRRLCFAGGDTSGYAARALGIEGLDMIARLTPGAPLCHAHAPGSPVQHCEIVFKGGQVGAVDYFGRVLNGRSVD